jgi:hypothetical protein
VILDDEEPDTSDPETAMVSAGCYVEEELSSGLEPEQQQGSAASTPALDPRPLSPPLPWAIIPPDRPAR